MADELWLTASLPRRDQNPRALRRGRLSKIKSDEMKAQVKPCRHPGGGEDAIILRPKYVSINVDVPEAAGKHLCSQPMGARVASSQ
jgi:hypothetical protein